MSECTLLCGDAAALLKTLPACSIQCCVTSPPYFGLRSYLPAGHPDKHLEHGTEQTPEAFVARLVDVFREVRRVLKNDGTLWVNIGDSFASHGRMMSEVAPSKQRPKPHKNGPSVGRVDGYKNKDLIGIPWMLAFALRADGWYLRNDIIWAKPAPMPESVTDRCTSSHEYLFLLAKSERYYYDAAAIAEPVSHDSFHGSSFTRGKTLTARDHKQVSRRERTAPETRNKRDVWTVNTAPYPGAHYATMPAKLVEPCIVAGSRVGDTILDPFFGSGTVAMVARSQLRSFVGIDLDERNIELARHRIGPMLLDTPAATMPVRPVSDKQAGTGSSTAVGFNARWEAKQRAAV